MNRSERSKLSGQDFLVGAYYSRLEKIEKDFHASSHEIPARSGTFKAIETHLNVIVDSLVGSRLELPVNAEVLAAHRLTTRYGKSEALLLARLQVAPPEFNYLDGPYTRSWNGPEIPEGGKELVLVSQTGEAFRHISVDNNDVAMIVRCPVYRKVDLERLDVDHWGFDFRFTLGAVHAQIDELRECFRDLEERGGTNGILPWGFNRTFLFDEVDFALQQAFNRPVEGGAINKLKESCFIVTLVDGDDRAYEVQIEWDAKSGRLSIDKPTEKHDFVGSVDMPMDTGIPNRSFAGEEQRANNTLSSRGLKSSNLPRRPMGQDPAWSPLEDQPGRHEPKPLLLRRLERFGFEETVEAAERVLSPAVHALDNHLAIIQGCYSQKGVKALKQDLQLLSALTLQPGEIIAFGKLRKELQELIPDGQDEQLAAAVRAHPDCLGRIVRLSSPSMRTSNNNAEIPEILRSRAGLPYKPSDSDAVLIGDRIYSHPEGAITMVVIPDGEGYGVRFQYSDEGFKTELNQIGIWKSIRDTDFSSSPIVFQCISELVALGEIPAPASTEDVESVKPEFGSFSHTSSDLAVKIEISLDGTPFHFKINRSDSDGFLGVSMLSRGERRRSLHSDTMHAS